MLAPFARAPHARIATRLAGAGRRLAASARRHWFLDHHAAFWLAELGSAWSPSALRARVIAVVDETADTRSFVLAPNRHWPGHRAGQYVPLGVEIDGVRVRRCYSISSGASGPGAARITITVKRVPGGRVSNWLHDHLRPGHLVELGRPAGDFVAPVEGGSLLLVAGGSGVTPIMAILRELERTHALADVVLVHAAHDAAGAIFERELAAMALHEPGLHVVAHHSATAGRLDVAELEARVPDLGDRAIYVCGPPGLLDVVIDAATRAGAGGRVRHERFVAAATLPAPAGGAATVQIGGRTIALDGDGTLLEQLERAGERPAHGCRMGICNTCRCTKQRGTVLDLTTGRVSSAPDEDIRPCVSVAQSDLELAPGKDLP